MKSFRVDGSIGLVTGAGSGMGRAMALLLAEAGAAELTLCGRTAAKLEETKRLVAKQTPACNVKTAAGDVAQPAFRKQLLTTLTSSGRLDFLVNNAGVFAGHSVKETTDTEWLDVYAVNVQAPFALVRDVLDLLKRSPHASIVNISSTLAAKPIPNAAAYNSAKAALVQLTRSLALELGPTGIRVNCILPAIVDTPMYRDRYHDDAAYQRDLDKVNALHPLGRIGTPEDIAKATLFLLSPAASWITGAALPVDGGMLCT